VNVNWPSALVNAKPSGVSPGPAPVGIDAELHAQARHAILAHTVPTTVGSLVVEFSLWKFVIGRRSAEAASQRAVGPLAWYFLPSSGPTRCCVPGPFFCTPVGK